MRRLLNARPRGGARLLLGFLPIAALILLYLVAAQMIRTGTAPLAIVETQSFSDMISAMRHLGGALRGWRYLTKGLALLAEIRRAGIPRFTAATSISIEGDGKAQAIRFTSAGRENRID